MPSTLIPFALIVPGGLHLGPVALVVRTDVPPKITMITLGVCALLQLVVHLRFFLHIDLSRQKREDLQLILFSVMLLTIMAGGTIWIMVNLSMRM